MVEAFFDELADGICNSDARGNILYLNPAARHMLGLTDSGVGRTLCAVLCGHLAAAGESECASTCRLLRPGSEGEAVTFQGNYGPHEVATWTNFRIRRQSVWKHLRVRCMKASASLVGEGKHLTIIEDVTADMELEKHKEEWRQMIAHDLRSPLTSVCATIRLLRESGGIPPEGGVKLVEAAERSCGKMLELLNLYLDVAKLDAGAAEARLVPVRLADVVRAEISAQEAAARAKKLEITSAVPEDLVVAADPDLLGRVVQNVLDNAVKFTDFGGGVALAARREGGLAALMIADGGPGIAAEGLPQLFDRYHQASVRPGALRGTGLGLAFCREALQLMGGSIEAASKPGEGAVFTVRLPAS